jgi:putative heme iron utilization protein
MAEAAQILRPTDDEARALARLLLRGSRYMSLAVLDPSTGFPSVSRALTAIDLDGVPVVLVSALSGHTKGLLADPRSSLLAGEPGKGDPLAHPRVTVQCRAEAIGRESENFDRIRTRFLCRHSKARLYIDFPDFLFFRLVPEQASLNGGFGRAYMLSGDELLAPPAALPAGWMALHERLALDGSAAAILARRLGLAAKAWRFGLVDPAGIDLICNDELVRHEFATLNALPEDVMRYICEPTKVQSELPHI